jgi:alpha-beta hydrolase superfamily lysophospholipase
MANEGYTVYGLDYRGHGISGGNRADSPNKERRIADLAETVQFLKGLGHSEVIVFGHSLGVASAILTAMAIPDDVSGLILLSGAEERRTRVATSPSLFQTTRVLASSLLRPSFQVVEYYRDGMSGMDDPLFNFKYTLRFLQMVDVKELVLPTTLNVPVLVAVGDKDELFEIDKVKLLYDEVPGNKKEFLVFKGTYHAVFPDESWNEVAQWINRNFPPE